MEKQVTAQDAARRLERRVALHGCSVGACDLCADQDTEDCLTPAHARPRPVLLPSFSALPGVAGPVSRPASPIDAQDAVFDALPCY